MKRFVPVFVVLMGAALLSSCYMMSVRPTGTISIDLGGPNGRAISPSAKVRIYLYTYGSTNNYSLFTFPSGMDYAEFSYGSGTQSLTGIPIGLWQVLVSVGSDGPSGTFQTTDYGQSSIIDVIGGQNSSASVTTSSAPPFAYSSNLTGNNVNSVAYNGQSGFVLYASTPDALYSSYGSGPNGFTDFATTPLANLNLPSGFQINSISSGYAAATTTTATVPAPVLYVNTTKGMFSYDSVGGGGFDPTFAQNLTDASGNPYSITQSAVLTEYNSSTSLYNLAIFYARANGMGGIYLTSAQTVPLKATWVDTDLSSTGLTNPVYDIAPNNGGTSTYTYFATKFGAFRISDTFVQSSSSGAGDLSKRITFTAPGNSVVKAITADYIDGTVYIGTSQGAYSAPINESSTANPTWTPVQGTQGSDIVGISFDPTYTGSVAFWSKYNLFLKAYSTGSTGAPITQYSTIPFFAGLPGEINSTTWVNGTLIIGGTEGLASLYVSLPGG